MHNRINPIKIKVVRDINFNPDDYIKVDYWFYGNFGEDILYYSQFLPLIKDKLSVSGLKSDQPVIETTRFSVRFKTRSRGDLKSLVGSINAFRLLKEGFLPIHGACVSDGSYALLMPAMPNTGKTYTTLWFLKRGYSYMSDDTIIIDREGVLYASPFPSAVGTKILDVVDMDLFSRVNLKLRTFLIMNIPKITKIIKPYMIKAWEIIDNTEIKDKASITHIFILVFGKDNAIELDTSKAVDLTQSINRYSLPRPNENPVLKVYSFFNPDLRYIKDYDKIEKDLLLRIFRRIPKYLVISKGRWGEIISKILRK